MNRAHNDLLKREGKNPFYHDALPKATMRLQQGIGRLLRTPDDFGVSVILDSRISSRRYGDSMLKNLPKDLPIMKLTTAELVKNAKKFLKKQRNNNE